jgi:heme a synthase
MNSLSYDTSLKKFRRLSILTIYAVIFLIWVGGWVRSTGSGMGCPDWPKCFGTWIPPTAENQLPSDYQTHFVELRLEKNQRVVKMLEKLGMHNIAFQIQNDPSIREPEQFNVKKTWIEYVNRLVGVLVGLFILATLIQAWKVRHHRQSIFWLSLAGFIGVVFEGWLGSIVVSTNLLPELITAHMFVAMLILVVLINAYMKADIQSKSYYTSTKSLARLGVFISIVALAQVLIGTQVREAVDVVAKSLGEAQRSEWIANLGATYLIHSRFYWLLVVAILVWLYQLKQYFTTSPRLKFWSLMLIGLVGIEVIMGISMHYLAIPPILQPFHLLFGTCIFATSYFITARLFNTHQEAN